MPTLIRPIAEAGAGEADRIVVRAFNDNEILTALRNGSGNLELISWQSGPLDTTITRCADSNGHAGTADELALALLGRTAITAVRSGSGNLLLITWNVPPGLSTVDRIWDSGTAAGEADLIAMTALSDTLFVTACRNGAGNLLLISWRLEPDGTINRLTPDDSLTGHAGEVSLVTITPVDASNVVTAVRNGSGNLELIGWAVSQVDGSINRWVDQAGHDSAEAGEAGEIALMPFEGDGATTDVVTAVQDGSGNLLLIVWRLNPADGTIERLADTHGVNGDLARTASGIALSSTVASSNGEKAIVASMRNGSGDLEMIAFELINDSGGDPIFTRTGTVTSEANSNTDDTALTDLEPGRIISAFKNDDNLQLITFRVSNLSPTLIRPLAEEDGGEADHIVTQAFNENEALTAFRDESGNLTLMSWHTASQDFAITPGSDSSGNPVDTAEELAMVLLGRIAITAIRSGSGILRLIHWDVPPGLTAVNRVWDTGSAAGEADLIAITALSDTLLVTACRNEAGNLLLISWRLEADGTISRLTPEGAHAGEVSLVTIAPVDASNVVTAVRNGSNNLELIGWNVSPVDGSIQRWPGQAAEAGEVWEIALLPFSSDEETTILVTAVQDGSWDLLLIAWRLNPADGTIERLADSHTQAGPGSYIATCLTLTAPSGTKTILVSMRNGAFFTIETANGPEVQTIGSSNLKMMAFDLINDAGGEPIFISTGDMTNEANTVITGTALADLEPGRIFAAFRVNAKLQLKTYSIIDAVRPPAPAGILELQFDNPVLPSLDDPHWARTHDYSTFEDTFPIRRPFEWAQTFDEENEYDDPRLIGAAGWVVAPEDSGGDMPTSHPFGFDWEFQIALDDDANGYPRLLSPANRYPEQNDVDLAKSLGLSVPRGVLGVEWDKGLLPQNFRDRVNHGDRVAILGRWILDEGHRFNGYFRTEIHPPLLVAAASVQQQPDREPFTRAIFMARPYLPGQTYIQNVDDAYNDSVGDDGSFRKHLFNEVVRVITLESRQIEFHPKIKSKPFQGQHQARFTVRPPAKPESGDYNLVVSYQFTRRTGVEVMVTSTASDAVNIIVTFDSTNYSPPWPPERKDRKYLRGELDQLNSENGTMTDLITVLVDLIAINIPIPMLVYYVTYILEKRGILTDEYAKLPEFNLLDGSHAALNVPVSNLPPNLGIVSDDIQPYPLFGWIEARWVLKRKPGLTTPNLNQWLKNVLSDLTMTRELRDKNWIQIIQDNFTLTKKQSENLSHVPPTQLKEMQKAIGMVLDYGGTIHVERKSEQGPGEVIVEPIATGPEVAAFSAGVFHCKFDANCRNWHCGWGPAKK